MPVGKPKAVAKSAPNLPSVQQYIRHFPFQTGKQTLLRYFMWRERIQITRTIFSTKMKVRTNVLVQGYIYYFGIWEPNLAYFVQSRLECNSNRTFIDVGANIGFFTLLGAKILSTGKVVSIEAFPSIQDRLLENVHLNKYNNIRAVNLAGTDKPCEISMYHAGNSNEGATTSLKGKYQSKPIVVKGLPLSDILFDTEIKTARLIKIDTEGAEYSVLRGLFPILDKMPEDVEVVVKISPNDLNEDEMLYIFSSFKAAGFSPYMLNNDYSTEFYLSFEKVKSLTRMASFPKKQTDIVFSKIDKEHLLLQQ